MSVAPVDLDEQPSAANSSAQKFRGIIPPMLTPLSGRDRLDVPGLERLLEHIIAGGVHGIFILGTTGEAPSLSYRLRKEMIERTCRQVAGRVPVLVGITDTSVVEMLQIARHAAEAQADGLVLAPPYYFPTAQSELCEFIEGILPEMPLPLFLYNMPQMTKVSFAFETCQRLAQQEKIVGIKDSGGDLEYFFRLLDLKRERPDWSLLVGPEDLLLPTMRRGGDGGVNGGANVHPKLYVNLYAALVAGDTARADALHQQLLAFGRIYSVGRHASSVIKGLKCGVSLLGICDGEMAEPFQKFRQPEQEQVRAVLRDAGLMA